MSDRPTRRSFLQASTAVAGGVAVAMVVPRHVLGGPRQIPPSEKMNVAGIGVGGMGAGNLANLQSENIVALCDVDLDHYAANTVKQYPKAKLHTITAACSISRTTSTGSCGHTRSHARGLSIAAMKAGKHVYCQKPLTHDVYEARQMAKVAKECKVATQMGIQGHSMEGIRLVTEWIAAGVIGEVHCVDAWCDLTYYPWGHAGWSSSWGERPKDTPPMPSGLNWDVWIGPAPWRPYHRAYHPATWRCFWDFGCGMMGRSRGAHTRPGVYGVETLPTDEHRSDFVRQHAGSASAVGDRHVQVPGPRRFPPLKLTWYEGTRPPRPDDLEDGRRWPAEGGSCCSRGRRARSWPASTATARGSSRKRE